MRIGVDGGCLANGRGYGRFTRELLRALLIAGRDHEFVPRLEDAFRTRTTAEWLTALEAADVIAGPVLDYAQATQDPSVLQNGLIQEFDHPVAGRLRAIGTPIRMSRTPASIRRCAPEIGEHTEEVLDAIGYGAEEIAKLRDAGVIRA